MLYYNQYYLQHGKLTLNFPLSLSSLSRVRARALSLSRSDIVSPLPLLLPLLLPLPLPLPLPLLLRQSLGLPPDAGRVACVRWSDGAIAVSMRDGHNGMSRVKRTDVVDGGWEDHFR